MVVGAVSCRFWCFSLLFSVPVSGFLVTFFHAGGGRDAAAAGDSCQNAGEKGAISAFSIPSFLIKMQGKRGNFCIFLLKITEKRGKIGPELEA